MFENPIIRRYRYSQLRPQQVWVFGSLYACVVMLMLFINTSVYRYGDGYATMTDLFRGLFVQFTILELFLLWLVCPTNCSNVVAKEIADKSFDFFRMLPVSASTKAIGILAGRNLFCLLAAAFNLCLCLFFAFAGRLSGAFIAQLITILVALTLALNMMALLFSVITYKKNKVTSIPVLLVIGLFTFGPVMGLLFDAARDQKLENTSAAFFGIEVPILYLVSLCAGFIAMWAYIGILRRFNREYESLFARTGAIVFMVSVMTVLLGLFYKSFGGRYPEESVWAFWGIGLVSVAVIPLFSMRSFDKYLEISRNAYQSPGLVVRLLGNSNYLCGLALYAIWLVFAVVACWMAQASPYKLLWSAMTTFSAYLVLLSLIETFVMWQPKNEKIGYLLGFLAILYFVLPLIAAGIFENEVFVLFSPFGFMTLFDNDHSVVMMMLPIFVNLLYLLPLGLLVGKRYYDLAVIRSQIEQPLKEATVR